MSKKKLRAGLFSFTGDEGCVITFLEILNYKLADWKNKVDWVHARVLKKKNELKNIDVAFIEGAISNKKELKMLKEIRKNSKKIVAIGSCAISGSPSNYRNFFDEKRKKEIGFVLKRFRHLPSVEPIEKYVKVDAQVAGCPIIEKQFVEVMDKYLSGFGVK